MKARIERNPIKLGHHHVLDIEAHRNLQIVLERHALVASARIAGLQPVCRISVQVMIVQVALILRPARTAADALEMPCGSTGRAELQATRALKGFRGAHMRQACRASAYRAAQRTGVVALLGIG